METNNTPFSHSPLAPRSWNWLNCLKLFVCCFASKQHLRPYQGGDWFLTCDSVHSWRLYSAVAWGNQAISTMTWYSTQSYYPDTEPTSPCSILIMPRVWLGSDKYTFLSRWFDSQAVVWLGYKSINRWHHSPGPESDSLCLHGRQGTSFCCYCCCCL